ncbi:MAG TPA: hypothetical protein VN690_08350, partial [Terriglobales bacterium]|nr:hypothetical protein [Terriglobales bacterium]
IDLSDRRVVASWPLHLGQHNTAMGFDPAAHRLFIGCRSGAIVVMNSDTGAEIKALAIAPGVDDIELDAATHRIYASSGGANGGDGSVAVYHASGKDDYTLLATVPTRPGARNSALVPEWGEYFVSAPASKGRPAAVLVFHVQ